MPACPVIADFDPLSPAYLADPYAVLAALPPAAAPVFYAPSIDYHVVTRHADVAAVFGDPATYSAAAAQLRSSRSSRSCSRSASPATRPPPA